MGDDSGFFVLLSRVDLVIVNVSVVGRVSDEDSAVEVSLLNEESDCVEEGDVNDNCLEVKWE